MPTTWGILERVEKGDGGKGALQVKAFLPGGKAIHIRASIEKETTVARGLERIDLSDLKAGEFVEVSYRYGHGGLLEAETVYVPPGDVPGHTPK